MQSHPQIKKNSLSVQFKQFKEIKEFIAKVAKQLNLNDAKQIAGNLKLFYQQFITAENGKTYLLHDILNLDQEGINKLNLKFITKQGPNVEVCEIQQAAAKKTLTELELVNNTSLARLLLDLSAKSNVAMLSVDLPKCPIHKLPLIFPAITFHGHTYENYTVDEILLAKNNDPIAQLPLTSANVINDISLKTLIWVLYKSRQRYKAKLKPRLKQPDDAEQAELIQELINIFDEDKILFEKNLLIQRSYFEEKFSEYNKNKLAALQHPELTDITVGQLGAIIEEKLIALDQAQAACASYKMDNRRKMKTAGVCVGAGWAGSILFLVINSQLSIDYGNGSEFFCALIGSGCVSALLCFMFCLAMYKVTVASNANEVTRLAEELSTFELVQKDKMLSVDTRERLEALPEKISEVNAYLDRITKLDRELFPATVNVPVPQSPLRTHSILSGKPTDPLLPPSSRDAAEHSYRMV